jgi:uncharacterized protein YehS (DUF1456 family)
MRTTIDIYDDLMRELRKKAQESGQSLKDVVNSTIRNGLKAQKRGGSGHRYRCPVFSIGAPVSYNIDKSLAISDELESEEIARKLRLRK